MNWDMIQTKACLRRKMIEKRKNLNHEIIQKTSLSNPPRILEFIRQKIPASTDRPLRIMSYMSFGSEFPTTDLNRAILENGWTLVLPFTDSNYRITACETDSLDNLRRSGMGIWEPDPAISRQVPAEETDLILLPGLAFDIHGNRLGYGKGCYDRFLSESAVKLPALVALAWSFQILESIPSEDHDQPCHFLFTEKEIIPTVRKSF